MEYREALAQKHQPVHPFSRVPTEWAPIERLFEVSKGTREVAFGIFYSVNLFELVGAEKLYEGIR
jgi:hypothetical protein